MRSRGLTLALALAMPWPAPPFEAWVRPGKVYLRASAGASRQVGIVRRGDVVRVERCLPDCGARHAWAEIAGPGALRLAELAPLPVPADASETSAAASYLYGRVRVPDTATRSAPRASAWALTRHKYEELLAFTSNASRRWLKRPGSGYVRRADIELLTPSRFAGELAPKLPLAFVRWTSRLRTGSGRAGPQPLRRYDRLPVVRIRGDRVDLPGGWLFRAAVRVARARPRPSGVGKRDRWVHVDADEQTLVAYEGDRPVLATLVSTGRARTPTRRGLFRVFAKTVHGTMRGRGWADYFAEEVPWILHFHGGEALHGTYWHDGFGTPHSHGCVNLSLADARWLFEWTPPPVPKGWHGVLPLREPPVWVWVTRRRPSTLPSTPPSPPASPSPPTPTGGDETPPAPLPLGRSRSHG
jgi:hypothetical protein